MKIKKISPAVKSSPTKTHDTPQSVPLDLSLKPLGSNVKQSAANILTTSVRPKVALSSELSQISYLKNTSFLPNSETNSELDPMLSATTKPSHNFPPCGQLNVPSTAKNTKSKTTAQTSFGHISKVQPYKN